MFLSKGTYTWLFLLGSHTSRFRLISPAFGSYFCLNEENLVQKNWQHFPCTSLGWNTGEIHFSGTGVGPHVRALIGNKILIKWRALHMDFPYSLFCGCSLPRGQAGRCGFVAY
ncbi:hypothetical protein XENTR_v10022685 [Xenopus tropicalis]|nr:hypothetical protein XENTR_v10022685 [Xenopus tropicalis]